MLLFALTPISIMAEPQNSMANNLTSEAVLNNVSCTYRTHVQNVGWQDWKSDGTMSGTSGQGLRLKVLK